MKPFTLQTDRFLEEDIMTFLGQTDLNNNNIISFGSGKPDEHYFEVNKIDEYITQYYNYLKKQEISEIEIYSKIGQYTHIKGIIPEIIKKYLETDFCFANVDENDVLLTVGAQEAFSLIITRFCEQSSHSIITENPSYIGFSSFAKLTGHDVYHIDLDESGGINLESLILKLDYCKNMGKPVQLVYVNPDFQNPTGSVMSVEKRKALLDLSNIWNFLIVEDNAYKIFQYEGHNIPTIKELDTYDRVIYVESFSKSVFPSIRLAILYVTGNVLFNNKLERKSNLIAEIKAYNTVNSPTLDQAVVAGILLQHNYSLKKYNHTKISAFKLKRDVMVKSINEYIENYQLPIYFTIPQGGFFLELFIPFNITMEQVNIAINKYNIVFCPMWFFYKNQKNITGKNSIRLSFSKPSEDKIKIGISRLFEFFKNECFYK